MVLMNTKNCPGYILLLIVCLVTTGFGYWILHKSEHELAREFYQKNSRLILKGEKQQARALQKEILAAGGDAPLNEVWLSLVKAQEDGYEQLLQYLRLLSANPQREASYAEIADLVRDAPLSFKQKGFKVYVQKLNSIPGIRNDFLDKFGLEQDGLQ